MTGGGGYRLEGFGGAKGADYGRGVALVGVDFGIELAHFLGGDFVGEVGEGRAELWEFCEGVAADDGDGVVGREVVFVVDQRDEVEGVDEAVGGIAGDDVDLFVDEGAVDEAEVHDAGRCGEMQAVKLAPATEAGGALEEFVAEAGAHFGSEGNDVGCVAEMEALGVFAADDHDESVLEAERLGDFEMETLGVALLHTIVDVAWVAAGGFVEDGG